jgi:hypothetical protein
LQRGEVIQEINHQTVSSAVEAIKLAKLAKTRQILLKIWCPDGKIGFTKWLTVDNFN